MSKGKLIIVDDSELDRAILAEVFKNVFDVVEFSSGYSALDFVSQDKADNALMILDVQMPVISGLEVLKQIKSMSLQNKYPIILVTAEGTKENVGMGFEYGMADFIVKPYDSAAIYQRLMNIIELYGNKKSVSSTVSSLVLTDANLDLDNIFSYDTKLSYLVQEQLNSKGQESAGHRSRVQKYVKIILQALSDNYSKYRLSPVQIELMSRASAYHDMGKISISESVLKESKLLDDENNKIYKNHTVFGAKLIRINTDPSMRVFVDYCADICLHHHERWDGTGFPYGLKGDDIPVAAQATSFAVMFDRNCRGLSGGCDFYFDRAIKAIYNDHNAVNPLLFEVMKNCEYAICGIAEESRSEV